MRKAFYLSIILLMALLCTASLAEDYAVPEEMPMLEVLEEYPAYAEETDFFSPEEIVMMEDLPEEELPIEDVEWEAPAEDIDPSEIPPEQDDIVIVDPTTSICPHDQGLSPSAIKTSIAECNICGKPLAAMTGIRLEIGAVFTLHCYTELMPEAPDGAWALAYTAPSGQFSLLSPQVAMNECPARYDGTVYRYDITGIRPQDMSDTITLQLQFNGTEAACQNEFSLRHYCEMLYSDGSLSTQQLCLLADLLEYGAACQQYAGKLSGMNVSDIDGIAALMTYRTDPSRPTAEFYVVDHTAETNQAYIAQAGLHFSDRIRLYVTVTADSYADMSLQINGIRLHLSGSGQALTGSGLMPAALGQPSVVRLFKGDQLLQTMSFSGEAYINACWDDAGALGYLVRRLRALELSLQRCQ